MSRPVDVLAVMDKYLADYARSKATDLREARAAVAELAEASKDFRDCLTVHHWSALTPARRMELFARYNPPQGTRPMRETEARFAAALEMFGGAA